MGQRRLPEGRHRKRESWGWARLVGERRALHSAVRGQLCSATLGASDNPQSACGIVVALGVVPPSPECFCLRTFLPSRRH